MYLVTAISTLILCKGRLPSDLCFYSAVFDVLKDKCPPPGESYFYLVHIYHLDLDVTSFHVEKVAHTLRGSGGPSRSDSSQW